MRLTENSHGQMIVDHAAGYAFVFQIVVREKVVVDVVDRHWEGSGPAPDPVMFEQQARRLAERMARGLSRA